MVSLLLLGVWFVLTGPFLWLLARLISRFFGRILGSWDRSVWLGFLALVFLDLCWVP